MKNLLFSILIISLSLSVSAQQQQTDTLYLSAEKADIAGQYLEKGAKRYYGGLGLAVFGNIILVVGAVALLPPVMIVGGVFSTIGYIQQQTAWSLINKSGRALRKNKPIPKAPKVN